MPKIIVNKSADGLEDAALSCPGNAFRKSENNEYVIHSDSCIECGLCQTMVAEGVIVDDTEATDADVKFNKDKSEEWNPVQ